NRSAAPATGGFPRAAGDIRGAGAVVLAVAPGRPQHAVPHGGVLYAGAGRTAGGCAVDRFRTWPRRRCAERGVPDHGRGCVDTAMRAGAVSPAAAGTEA